MNDFVLARPLQTQDLMIVFKKLPFPPADDKRWMKIWGNLVPTTEFKNFKRDMLLYMHRLDQKIEIKSDRLFLILKFFISKNTLLNAKDGVKKWDVQNRGGAIINSISELINIDDCHFFRVQFEKELSPNELEFVDAAIEPMAPTRPNFKLRRSAKNETNKS